MDPRSISLRACARVRQARPRRQFILAIPVSPPRVALLFSPAHPRPVNPDPGNGEKEGRANGRKGDAKRREGRMSERAEGV
jgi:hypothetical protein